MPSFYSQKKKISFKNNKVSALASSTATTHSLLPQPMVKYFDFIYVSGIINTATQLSHSRWEQLPGPSGTEQIPSSGGSETLLFALCLYLHYPAMRTYWRKQPSNPDSLYSEALKQLTQAVFKQSKVGNTDLRCLGCLCQYHKGSSTASHFLILLKQQQATSQPQVVLTLILFGNTRTSYNLCLTFTFSLPFFPNIGPTLPAVKRNANRDINPKGMLHHSNNKEKRERVRKRTCC